MSDCILDETPIGTSCQTHDVIFAESAETCPYAIIATLQAENIKLRAAQRWIPVSEALPDIGADFLVYDAYYEGHEDFSCIRFGRRTKSWGISAVGANYASETITHWMHLPLPPLENNNE